MCCSLVNLSVYSCVWCSHGSTEDRVAGVARVHRTRAGGDLRLVAGGVGDQFAIAVVQRADVEPSWIDNASSCPGTNGR